MPSVLEAKKRLELLPPPNIDATELCAHLAFLRIAEVTVMHSVVMSEMGSLAMAGMGGLMFKSASAMIAVLESWLARLRRGE